MSMVRIDLENGKYTYIREEVDGKVRHEALRYGEPWRDFTGDKFILSMGFEVEHLCAEIERLTRERDEAKTDAEEWQDKYNDEHKTADELSIKLEGARKDWSLQSKISDGYAGALIIAEKARDAALARAEAADRERDEAIARGDRWMERHRDASRLLEAERNAALDARDESIGHLHEAALKLRDAEAKVAKLREALTFYARHTVYRISTVYMSGSRGMTEIECDGGNKARTALQETETKGE